MLLVVGGHSRDIGKTSLMTGLIRNLRSRDWTALKITQYGNSLCTHHTGETVCGCEPEDGSEFALSEEYEPNDTDTGRFLKAGAKRSLARNSSACSRPAASRKRRRTGSERMKNSNTAGFVSS